MNKRTISVVITDLDNTLFDWFGIWYRCFRPMLNEIVRISGVPEQRIIREIRTVHQKYGTTEYAFLIEELPSVRRKHPNGDIRVIYDAAIEAYRENRRRHLRLYPTVMDTLASIKQAGCLLVAYTESVEFYTNYRIRKLGLDGVIDVVYSPPDHAVPEDFTPAYPPETYTFARTVQRHTPEGEYKPNPKVLLGIIGDIGAAKDEAVYVGDSLHKDIQMAQAAGVLDVFAAYGRIQEKEAYDLLGRVTHWTQEMVERERSAAAQNITPSITLKKEFAEMRAHVHFVDFGKTGE
ncbi:MAG: HAD family hydrolase [Deltaproteobacteria bacterium]|nr:HAD family hydrolase [Candidatus Zymogenaceae bacterium]